MSTRSSTGPRLRSSGFTRSGGRRVNDIGETAVASRAVRLVDSMWRKIQSLESDLELLREDLWKANKRIEELETARASVQQKVPHSEEKT